MTAASVPSTSIRGSPSSLAGTTCSRDRSCISDSALRSTIRCRIDQSGRFRCCFTRPRHPRISATVPTHRRPARRTPAQQQFAPGVCSNCPTEPFPGLPIGDKRAFPSLTMSAPNSSQKYNSLQNRRDRRSARRPRSPRPPRPVRPPLRRDVSPHHDLDKGCANVFGQMKTRPNTPISSTSRTPTSRAFFALFCHQAATTTPRHAPPPQQAFCHWRPNWGLSSKCSQIIPLGGRFAPVSALPRPV